MERISIELTNRCSKACWFCYNHSHAGGATEWTADEVVGFVRDCCEHGLRAVSFGGGEPLQHPQVFEILERLDGLLFRSLTTNGLLLRDALLERLVAARPDKVHVSIHFPEDEAEVTRVCEQVGRLAERGVKSGVNLLVSRANLEGATRAARRLSDAGVGPDRVVYLPQRGTDTPTPRQLAQVAGGERFQSMSCLTACEKSPWFCSIGWDRSVAWCSYTTARRKLTGLTYAGLAEALCDLPLTFCGGTT